ncbi:MAG TPA: phosphate acyltransferase PlsX [Acidimicrobiales bacterium]
MLPVAVDAMGGDDAPGAIIEGARAAANLGIPVILVGRPEALRDTGGLPVYPASEVIEMGDDPAQGVRRKKDSSLVRCAELVRDGKASAMVSAGNTGATMASALLRMGRIKGVSRPAIATPLPVPGTTPTTLLDAGANAECQPEWLVQFAQMGSVYASHRFGISVPRVGLLSIGEESSKGDSMVKETHALLRDAPGVSFIGNVEGRDILTDDVDVVVTDGFTGNVVLKTLEGGVKMFVRAMQDRLDEHPELRRRTDPVLDPLWDALDPDTYGGAMLLGVDGVCIISHGSSTPKAMVNAIEIAREMVDVDIVGLLRAAITLS